MDSSIITVDDSTIGTTSGDENGFTTADVTVTVNENAAEGGRTTFYDSSSAGSATFFEIGSSLSGFNISGVTYFYGDSSAANATFIINREQAAGGEGGKVVFSQRSTAGSAILQVYEGANRYFGGHVVFEYGSTGGEARIELLGPSTYVDLSNHETHITLGSIEGKGEVDNTSLRGFSLGQNNLDTVFSGVITGNGSLTKIGEGRLVLKGANTYYGGTVVKSGRLEVSNTTGSGTGTGAIEVIGGTLGGVGVISGSVMIGTGRRPGGALAPGGARAAGFLTIQNTLTFAAMARYNWNLNAEIPQADEVAADGLTIDPAALFSPVAHGSGPLPIGTVFTVIDNTAAVPISGIFSNLPDGGTITIGSNTFQANYEGGDGNDFTLTVIP